MIKVMHRENEDILKYIFIYYQNLVLIVIPLFREQFVIFMNEARKKFLHVDHVILICYWKTLRNILIAQNK